MRRPVLLGYTGAWKAIDTPPALGTATAAFTDFDACKQHFGGGGDAATAAAAATTTTTTTADALLTRMLYNKVRVCPSCHKPNGFTLCACNSCGTDISTAPLSKTLNVFSGFMLSIAKSTFPLTISLRAELRDMIAIDDLLALSPCHINVIPTKQFIPDWRYLLRRPAEGLALAQRMLQLSVDTVRDAFLSQPDWLASFTTVADKGDASSSSSASTSFTPETDLSTGFNFPPSQNQLHLQCIFPVVLPYQYYLFERNMHFTPGRFFPHEYVVAALTHAVASPLPEPLLRDDTPMEAITEHFRARHDLDAERVRLAFVERFDRNCQRFGAWPDARFKYVATHDEASGKLLAVANPKVAADVVASGGAAPAASDAAAVDAVACANADKTALQSYGRPYTAEGKPQGRFYQYPATALAHIDFW